MPGARLSSAMLRRVEDLAARLPEREVEITDERAQITIRVRPARTPAVSDDSAILIVP
jgi:hypothetical protein